MDPLFKEWTAVKIVQDYGHKIFYDLKFNLYQVSAFISQRLTVYSTNFAVCTGRVLGEYRETWARELLFYLREIFREKITNIPHESLIS
jgi:hypothetical protein